MIPDKFFLELCSFSSLFIEDPFAYSKPSYRTDQA